MRTPSWSQGPLTSPAATILTQGESPIVGRHEPRAGCPRGESQWSAKDRSHGEVRVESAGSGCCLQRSDVYVEFTGKLVERQQLGLSLVLGDHGSRPLQHRRGQGTKPAVPHAKRIDRDGHPRGKLVLREISGATQFADFGHRLNTMPCTARVVKRAPAYSAGDHDPLWRDLVRARKGRIAKHSAKQRIMKSRDIGPNSRE